MILAPLRKMNHTTQEPYTILWQHSPACRRHGVINDESEQKLAFLETMHIGYHGENETH